MSKENNKTFTKYFRNIGLVGLTSLAYVGVRHISGAGQIKENFHPKSLQDALIITDYVVGGLGSMAFVASAIWTPFCYILEKHMRIKCPMEKEF